MVVLRATQKVLRLLPQSGHSPDASDTALGDWYVNRIVVPARLAEIVAARLRRLCIDDAVVAAEIAAMRVVAIAKTIDRAVTGQVVDFVKTCHTACPRIGGATANSGRRKTH